MKRMICALGFVLVVAGTAAADSILVIETSDGIKTVLSEPVLEAVIGADVITSETFVQVKLSAGDSDTFGTFTAENVGTPVSIFVCDELLLQATVRAAIPTGIIGFSNDMTEERAAALFEKLQRNACG